MALYCAGDIQGCADALERLLAHIGFSPSRDTLYLLGDLVNRGPDSAAVVRHCMAAEGSILALLGNHDLHLLALAHGVRPLSRRDTLDALLKADDRNAMLDWLRQQPLARSVVHGGERLLMVHAGVLPQWSAEQALALAGEVHGALRGSAWPQFLQQMYGNQPDRWNDTLAGAERLRAIVNALTRLRFCTSEGVMDFSSSEAAATPPAGLLPWFDVPGRATQNSLIAFGHWSTLGWMNRPHLLALDTGCVWGGSLSAVRFGATLADREHCEVPCPRAQQPG
ncbi:MAG: bis(5'-nucleosyl)-tetraphosphatase (symmetrical) [Comamonas sp. SCN 65-56]|uniref:symmetrical bis(5'-nucleosyl)-tetraphosphatase n=1 Tax=Comamonas sp. SCN 65-56 TaxID=1660095 RepID=UPI00086F539C|nr:symmetrical bis(5'-nucleosyl)-tetraphosphatase [Comamonas sp. SCN 65-56]ODS93717.1 MAG: bis(5'-nucleosyl)-tetraphosphatase (symmetrical) [Comamonas sp. SCN 65-56]